MESQRIGHDWATNSFHNGGFPGDASDKEPACSVGDLRDVGLIPGSEKPLEEPTPYSCLENSMDREAWWATVHRVAKSQTWLKGLSTQSQLPYFIASPPMMLPVLLNADCVPWWVLITSLTSAKLIFQTSLRRGTYRCCYIPILSMSVCISYGHTVNKRQTQIWTRLCLTWTFAFTVAFYCLWIKSVHAQKLSVVSQNS